MAAKEQEIESLVSYSNYNETGENTPALPHIAISTKNHTKMDY